MGAVPLRDSAPQAAQPKKSKAVKRHSGYCAFQAAAGLCENSSIGWFPTIVSRLCLLQKQGYGSVRRSSKMTLLSFQTKRCLALAPTIPMDHLGSHGPSIQTISTIC